MAVQLSDLQTELNELRQRIERLEAEVAALRLKNGNPIVARYKIEGEEYLITQADVDRVKAETAEEGPIDDVTDKDWQIIALSEKLAERRKDEPPEVRYERSMRSFEAARAKIIAEGRGIDNEYEAAIGD